jgi:hypothetical protein
MTTTIEAASSAARFWPSRNGSRGVWTSGVGRLGERVNAYKIFDAGVAFGGYELSGWGSRDGEHVIHEYPEIEWFASERSPIGDPKRRGRPRVLRPARE